jgi:hypothetical protein
MGGAITTPSGNADKRAAILRATTYARELMAVLTAAAAEKWPPAVTEPFSPRAKLLVLMRGACTVDAVGGAAVPDGGEKFLRLLGFHGLDDFLELAAGVKALLPLPVMSVVMGWARSRQPPNSAPWVVPRFALAPPSSSPAALTYHFFGLLASLAAVDVAVAPTRPTTAARAAQPLAASPDAALAMLVDRLAVVAPPPPQRAWPALLLALESMVVALDPTTGGRIEAPVTAADLVRGATRGAPLLTEVTVGALVFGADVPREGGATGMAAALARGLVGETSGFVVPPAVVAPTLAWWKLALDELGGAAPDADVAALLHDGTLGKYYTLGWAKPCPRGVPQAEEHLATLLAMGEHVVPHLVLEIVSAADGAVYLLHRGVTDPALERGAATRPLHAEAVARRLVHTDWYAAGAVAAAQTGEVRARLAALPRPVGRLVAVGARLTDGVLSRRTEMAALVAKLLGEAVLRGIREGARHVPRRASAW